MFEMTGSRFSQIAELGIVSPSVHEVNGSVYKRRTPGSGKALGKRDAMLG